MFLAAVLFSGPGWILPAAAFVGVAAVLLWWSYRRAPLAPGVRAACVGLKLAGLLALAACLLEPLWSRQRAKPGANFFVVLADNSQGLSIQDAGSARRRGDALRGLLTGEGTAWQAALDENFQVRRYVFDARLQPTRDFSELRFDGRATALQGALRSIRERYEGQPLAGVLLLTDGNATDLPGGVLDAAGLPPVYPVVVGTDDPVRDVAVTKFSASQTAFEDAPVTVQAEVTAAGYAGATLVAQLWELPQPPGLPAPPAAAPRTNEAPHQLLAPVRTNAPPPAVATLVATQAVTIARGGGPATVRFQVRPTHPGLCFYQLRAAPREELAALGPPAGAPSPAAGATPAPGAAPASTEATLANNVRTLVVDRGRGPYRILYLAGRPNWEFKFLNRAVMDDDQMQLVGLFRVARREAKFEFRGRQGESSNPLFRGFGNQSKEEIERYDQPVFRTVNAPDEDEWRRLVQGGFPKLPEDLYKYHAVVVDDVEAEFFSADQMALVQKFVAERGGGFLMLGGTESFKEGKFHRTPIGDLLPVYLDAPPETRPPGDLRLALTREGWLQPWARLRNNEADERRRLEEVAPFAVLNKVRGIKPGASVIATVTDPERAEHPALAVQRFGNGRVGAMLLGDVWHWGFKDEASHRDMDKAWRQLMRWLVADVPVPFSLQVEPKPGDPSQSILVRARARDRKFQPLENAGVTLAVRPVGAVPAGGAAPAPPLRLPAEAAGAEPGLYEASYVPRETGGYAVEAVFRDPSGLELGRAEAGWTSDPAADEFRSLQPNRALMETLARQTGGELVAAGGLEALVKSLPNRAVPVTETVTSPLWHQTGVFLFALACFVAEWGLRRRRGLA
ncbi:MAG: hypothetical protein RJA22_13 [Verrucomicrobiota bacterium]